MGCVAIAAGIHMRWALLVAAGCFICASQPGYAAKIALRLSKPNGTWSAYLDDTAACHPYRTLPPRSNGPVHFRLSETELIARSTAYFSCMAAKGYQPDPNGYRAAIYIQLGDTDILVPSI
jgi:hypothetical protein